MLHTKFHGSMPSGFREEDCFMFILYDNNLNKLGRGPLDDAEYQISRLEAGFRSRFFLCFHYTSQCKILPTEMEKIITTKICGLPRVQTDNPINPFRTSVIFH